MWFAELLFAFIIALIFSFVLVALFGRGRRSDEEAFWPAFIFLFFILFLATWAGGAWVTPFGPTAWGTFWLPFIIVGLVFALLLLAVLPPMRRRHPAREAPPEDAEVLAIGGFFWILLIVLAVAVLVSYVL